MGSIYSSWTDSNNDETPSNTRSVIIAPDENSIIPVTSSIVRPEYVSMVEESYSDTSDFPQYIMHEKTVGFVPADFSYPSYGSNNGTPNASFYIITSDYFGFIVESVEISEAQPKLKQIEVPYRDSVVDITDFFGDVKFSNRTVTVNFIIPWQHGNPRAAYSDFATLVAGLRFKLILASDVSCYYEGRCTFGGIHIEDGLMKFTVTMDAEPYKMQDHIYYLNGSRRIVITSARMVSPIYVSGTGTIESITAGMDSADDQTICPGSRIAAFSSSTKAVVPYIYLHPGRNYIYVSCSGDIQVHYRLGKL